MRLRRSNASGRGYRRAAAGAGFSYKDLDGSALAGGQVRDRLDSIGIPPAWTDVWIAPYDNGHIQATGLDAVGRGQWLVLGPGNSMPQSLPKPGVLPDYQLFAKCAYHGRVVAFLG